MTAQAMHPTSIARSMRLVGDDAGLIVSSIDGGAWAALRSLRAGMRRAGTDARLTFLLVLTADGRIVDLQDDAGTVLIAGYRTTPPDRTPVEPIP